MSILSHVGIKKDNVLRARKYHSKNSKFDILYNLIGSAFGLGLSPIAPGSVGAILGVVIHLVIVSITPIHFHLVLIIGAFLVICAANVMLSEWAENFWGEEDPKHFVLDEVAGYLMIPIFFNHISFWLVAPVGYLLFRIFDIVKIPPARHIDKNMKGGWGILLDDLVSSVYVIVVMKIIFWFFLKRTL